MCYCMMRRQDYLCGVQTYRVGESGEDVAANLNMDKITILVEHPVPIDPPAEEAPPPPMPLMLTAKVDPPHVKLPGS